MASARTGSPVCLSRRCVPGETTPAAAPAARPHAERRGGRSARESARTIAAVATAPAGRTSPSRPQQRLYLTLEPHQHGSLRLGLRGGAAAAACCCSSGCLAALSLPAPPAPRACLPRNMPVAGNAPQPTGRAWQARHGGGAGARGVGPRRPFFQIIAARFRRSCCTRRAPGSPRGRLARRRARARANECLHR